MRACAKRDIAFLFGREAKARPGCRSLTTRKIHPIFRFENSGDSSGTEAVLDRAAGSNPMGAMAVNIDELTCVSLPPLFRLFLHP